MAQIETFDLSSHDQVVTSSKSKHFVQASAQSKFLFIVCWGNRLPQKTFGICTSQISGNTPNSLHHAQRYPAFEVET